MKKLFKAEIINEETEEVLIKIETYSEESLLEEMGKKKWLDYTKQEDEVKNHCPNCGERCSQNSHGRVIKDTDCDNCDWCSGEGSKTRP